MDACMLTCLSSNSLSQQILNFHAHARVPYAVLSLNSLRCCSESDYLRVTFFQIWFLFTSYAPTYAAHTYSAVAQSVYMLWLCATHLCLTCHRCCQVPSCIAWARLIEIYRKYTAGLQSRNRHIDIDLQLDASYESS